MLREYIYNGESEEELKTRLKYMCMMNLIMDGLLVKRRSVVGILWLLENRR